MIDGLIELVTGNVGPEGVLNHIWEMLTEDPHQTFIILTAVGGAFGVTIRSGWAGVKFRFGRLQKVLEPGFHFLWPTDRVVKTHCRDFTLDLMKQQVETQNGFVYEIDANLVYFVEKPEEAVIEIDKFHDGVRLALANHVSDIVRNSKHKDLKNRDNINVRLRGKLETTLSQWGLGIRSAGFTSLNPNQKTLELSQVRLRAQERQRILSDYLKAGVNRASSLQLLGMTSSIRAKSSAAYNRKLQLVNATYDETS